MPNNTELAKSSQNAAPITALLKASELILTARRKSVTAAHKLLNWNHQLLGKAYILLALASGVLGTSLSLLIRAELQKPGIQIFKKLADVLYRKESSFDKAKHLYNASVTAHGLIMIFYMLMPTLVNGLGCLTLPALIKTDELAFPKAGVLAF